MEYVNAFLWLYSNAITSLGALGTVNSSIICFRVYLTSKYRIERSSNIRDCSAKQDHRDAETFSFQNVYKSSKLCQLPIVYRSHSGIRALNF